MGMPRLSGPYGDVSVAPDEAKLVRLKGEPTIVFSNQQQPAMSDAVFDMHDHNGLIIKVLVSGLGPGGVGLPSADIELYDSESIGGEFLPCTDANGMLLAVHANVQTAAICGGHYGKISITNISGQFKAGQGYTVICWPYVAAGQSNIQLTQNVGNLVNANITEVAGAGIGSGNPLPIAGPVSSADGGLASVGATTDAEAAAGNGTLVALLKRLRTLLGGGGPGLNVSGSGAALGAITGTSPAAPGTAAVGGVLTGLGLYRSLLIVATLTGATGGTVDAYLQTSPDGGTTWVDYAHFAQLAAAAAVRNLAITVSRGQQSGAAPVAVGTNLTPALAANTVVGGSFADRLRLVVTAGAGTTAGAVQTITAYGAS